MYCTPRGYTWPQGWRWPETGKRFGETNRSISLSIMIYLLMGRLRYFIWVRIGSLDIKSFAQSIIRGREIFFTPLHDTREK